LEYITFQRERTEINDKHYEKIITEIMNHAKIGEGILLKRESSLPSSMALPLDTLEKAMNQKLLLLLKHGRHIEGKLLGFDEYMNLVIDEVEETKGETKRRLGKIILRGSNVVSISLS